MQPACNSDTKLSSKAHCVWLLPAGGQHILEPPMCFLYSQILGFNFLHQPAFSHVSDFLPLSTVFYQHSQPHVCLIMFPHNYLIAVIPFCNYFAFSFLQTYQHQTAFNLSWQTHTHTNVTSCVSSYLPMLSLFFRLPLLPWCQNSLLPWVLENVKGVERPQLLL